MNPALESHRVQPEPGEGLRRLIPFGLGSEKPHHFRDMLRVAWSNRDNLGYAWKVLSKGVCDGCALGVAGFHDWTIDGVHLCMTRLNLLRLNTMPAMDHTLLEDVNALASRNNGELRELGRLAYPMVRESKARGFKKISWDEALDRVAARLKKTDPKRWAMFVTARGVTNEVYYLAQKAARCIGTNHVDNAARLCHAPSTSAMKATMGVSASTCSYKDWYGSDVIVFFGSNPANDQPLTTKYLHEARKLGTKVVLVNPYLEPGMKRYWVPSTLSSAVFGSDLTDFWFPVAQGGDIAFLNGVIKALFANNLEDKAFLTEHVHGWETLRQSVEGMEWSALEAGSGLKRTSMEAFAELIGQAKTGVFVWSMGITQNSRGADAVQMVLNTGLVRGFVGREKCGLMPIRGHSSVQGSAEMGAYSTVFPGGVPIHTDSARQLSEQYGFPVPDWPGLAATEMLSAAARGELDLLYSLGGNFLRTLPDPETVRKALERLPVRVHQDILVNDQMLLDSRGEVLLLPAKTRYEQDDGGTETTTERRIAFSPEIPRQVGEAMAEWKILRELAIRTRPEFGSRFGCENGWKIREEIARVVPFYKGVETLRETGDAIQYGGPRLCERAVFSTSDGKATVRPVLPPPSAMGGETFVVSTRRGKQFNTLIYAEVDPLNGAPRDAVLMGASDATRLGLRQGQRIRLESDSGWMEGSVFLSPMAPGNLQVHWPEGNVLLPSDRLDPVSKVPDYNTRVTLAKADRG